MNASPYHSLKYFDCNLLIQLQSRLLVLGDRGDGTKTSHDFRSSADWFKGRSYVGMAAMGSGFYAVAFAQAHPSPDHFEHILQLSSLVSTFFNLSVGVLLRIPQTMKNYSIKDDMDDSLAITVMLVFANVAITGLLVGKYRTLLTFLFPEHAFFMVCGMGSKCT